MDYEAFLDEVGSFNRYQAFLYFVVVWSNSCLSGNLFFMAVGALAPTHWRCFNGATDAIPEFQPFSSDICRTVINCPLNNRQFQANTSLSNGFYSLAVHYGLVCNRTYATSTIIFQQMIGLAIGTTVFGPLSDIYGRKKVWMLSSFIEMIIGGYLSLHLSVSWYTYANWRFILGIFMGGHLVSIWTILVESVGRKYRFALFPIGFAFMGQIWFAFLAYKLRDWRILTFVANFQSLPSLLLIFFFVPESPRWLMSKKNSESEALKVFQTIGRWNGRSTTFSPQVQSSKHHSPNPNSPLKINREYFKIAQVFHHRCTAPLIINWLSVAVIIFGLAFHVGNLFGNPFLLLAATGFFPWISYLFATFLDRTFHSVGRKFIHCYSLAIPSILFILIAMQISSTGVATLSQNMTIAVMITYGIAYGAWLTNYQMTSELYPTEIRTTAMGLCTGISRIGAAISPYIFNLSQDWPAFPYLFIGISTTVSLILAMTFIKETKGKALPD